MYDRVQAACVAAAVVCFACPAQAQTLPPVDAFGTLPQVSEPLLAPDGKHFALIRPVSGRPAAVIFETNPSPGSKPALVGGGDNIIAAVQWAKNDRLIVIAKQSFVYTKELDPRMRTWVRSFSVDLSGSNAALLLGNIPAIHNNVGTADIIDVNLDHPDNILMGLWQPKVHMQEDFNTRIRSQAEMGTFKYDVMSVNVRTGKAELFRSGDPTTFQWLSDGHGNPVVNVSRTERPLKDHVYANRHSGWTEIGTFDASADNGAGVLGMTEDGAGLVLRQLNGASYMGLLRRDVETGADTPLFFAPQFDVSGAIADEWTGRIIGASYLADGPKRQYFDASRQALQSGVEAAFPGLSARIVSWDLSKTIVIVGVESPQQPELYYLLNRTTHQTTLLAGTYPGLKPNDLGEMKAYGYTARDGLSIPAYLTLPPGKTPKNLPVVVFPHGGPDERDALGFAWDAQFLANRGYAVLQPNFRGSSGYGHKFTEAGLHQWGLKIQDDITDGVRKLIADGIADPKRICIVGGSFGGYAALAGTAFTPDLYACAASWAGPSDLPALLHNSVTLAGGNSGLVSFWRSRMGEDLDQLAAASPSRHVENVKCPILLMHGEGDTTVPIGQSEIMNAALLKAGKKVEFIRFNGEDHYMSLAATRIRYLSELEKFLKANIGN